MPDPDKKQRAVEEMLKARRKADRLLDRTAIDPTRKVYEQESNWIIRALSRMFKGKTRETLRKPLVVRATNFLGIKIPQAGKGLAQVLSGIVRGTLTEGVQTTAALLGRIRKTGSPLDDITTVGRLVAARQNNIEALRRQSAANLAGSVRDDVIKRLLKMPVEGARVSDLITETGDLLDREWWQIERTVRTETSYAYNQAQDDSIRHLVATEPGMRGMLYSRWTEMINDLTGQPFDDRVANDSKVLHGQLATPGRPFTMPSDPLAPQKMIGMSWTHPPNRPNDRAVLTPWMADWGVPGWMLRAGRRIRL